jgi:hypothetical protein
MALVISVFVDDLFNDILNIPIPFPVMRLRDIVGCGYLYDAFLTYVPGSFPLNRDGDVVVCVPGDLVRTLEFRMQFVYHSFYSNPHVLVNETFVIEFPSGFCRVCLVSLSRQSNGRLSLRYQGPQPSEETGFNVVDLTQSLSF